MDNNRKILEKETPEKQGLKRQAVTTKPTDLQSGDLQNDNQVKQQAKCRGSQVSRQAAGSRRTDQTA